MTGSGTSGIQVLDCAKIRGGVGSVLAQLPEVAGVYAWFRGIRLPEESAGAEAFASCLLAYCDAPHAPPASARLPPLLKVTVESHHQFSHGKRALLLSLCSQRHFRDYVRELLRAAPLLMQAPLYVGKATDLRVRVEDHLLGRSGLKERVSAAGIDLRACILSYIPVADDALTSADVTSVVEELLSHLFVPPFTLRYG